MYKEVTVRIKPTKGVTWIKLTPKAPGGTGTGENPMQEALYPHVSRWVMIGVPTLRWHTFLWKTYVRLIVAYDEESSRAKV